MPNAAGQVLLGVLNLALAPRAAGIAYATMYLAAVTWLAWRLATRDGRVDGARFLLILLISGINSPYWQGYANSQLGLALFMLHLLRQRDGGSGTAWDALLGVALFFCHAVMLTVFAVFAVFVASRGLRERHLIRAALVLALPFALLGWYLLRDDNYGEEIPLFGTTLFDFVAYKAYTAAKLGPYHNMIIGGLGDADRAPLVYWAGVALNLGFALLVLGPLAFVSLRDIWRGDRSPALLTAAVCLAGFAVLPSAIFGVVNVGERLLLPAMVIALAYSRDPWRFLALPAPAMIVYFFLILPAALPTAGIGHLAAHEPGQRWRLLFWHRPFQFQAQIAAAQRGEPIRLGFTTSLLRARAFGPKLSP